MRYLWLFFALMYAWFLGMGCALNEIIPGSGRYADPFNMWWNLAAMVLCILFLFGYLKRKTKEPTVEAPKQQTG